MASDAAGAGGPTERWSCIAAARAHDPAARVAFFIDDADGARRVGSVARAHLAALRALAGRALRIDVDAVCLAVPAARRDTVLAELNAALRGAGLIAGWRDEPYAVVEHPGAPPLACIERAAARFWGTLCIAAHANGYVADARGHPALLWLARRSASKATDPGLLDNLVGGGVPFGQTPFETLVREGWEEAGLDAPTMRRAVRGRVAELMRDVAEGLQHERVVVHDLALPADARPVNRDGEVAELRCVEVGEAVELAASSGEMTVDAALATLDFALRHRLVAAHERDAVERAAAAVLA